MNILVTGGYGFIGSNFIRLVLEKTDYTVINLDALTYAGNKDNLKDIEDSDRYTFIHGRIEDFKVLNKLEDKNINAVVNFAAETHVDRSILEPSPFIKTNIIGTYALLEFCRKVNVEKFVHISTDEVYGSLESDEGLFSEESPLKPNSPYSASKASADMLVRSYYITYKLPALIVRPSNNYGPYQYPEKFIPLSITNLIDDLPVPVYGDGRNIRDWLFVKDCVDGILKVLNDGKIGEVYNIGGENEKRNIEVVKTILKMMNKDESYIKFVPDRPGHDYRYALDNSKIRKHIGWKPRTKFEDGIKQTIEWYKSNEWWWRPIKKKLNNESKGFWTR